MYADLLFHQKGFGQTSKSVDTKAKQLNPEISLQWYFPLLGLSMLIDPHSSKHNAVLST